MAAADLRKSFIDHTSFIDHSGIKLFGYGVLARYYSPDLFNVDTPAVIGSASNVAIVVLILSIIMVPMLDYAAGPRGPNAVHESAVRWLNKAKMWEPAPGAQISRLAVFASCAATALGEEMMFRCALIPLIPPFGALDQYMPFAVPTGHIISVLAYAWYKGPDDGGADPIHGLASVGYAIAAMEAGVLASTILNFVTNLAMASMYFHARMRARKESSPKPDGAGKAADGKKSGAGNKAGKKK